MENKKSTKTHIYTSPMNRVVETSGIFENKLNEHWIETSLKIRKIFSYENEEYYPKEVLDEWYEKCKAWESENNLVKDFLDGKRNTKPIMLARSYLEDMERIFKRVIRKESQFSIVSFRHWAKTKKWKLSKLWKQQAMNLWEKVWKNIEQHENTIFIATHNTINESIVRCLVNDLPNEWREPLDFTETVKYTFYPESRGEETWEDKEPYMEIEWRWITKKITYSKFNEIINSIGEKN